MKSIKMYGILLEHFRSSDMFKSFKWCSGKITEFNKMLSIVKGIFKIIFLKIELSKEIFKLF